LNSLLQGGPILHPDIDLGDFPSYMLMAGIGLVAATLIAIYNLSKYKGKNSDRKYEFIALMLASFLIGAVTANIGNWFFIPGKLQLSLWDRIATSGYNFYSGIIGFFIMLVILLLAFRLDVKAFINLAVPSVLIFHAFGRIGCSLAGCCYGVPVNIDLGLFKLYYFPAREIECLLLFAMFFIVQFGIKKRRMLFYAIAYPVARFCLEFGRGDLRGRMFTSFLSPAQEISVIILFGVGIYGIVKWIQHIKKKGREAAQV
jgi:phosphatidylglycerol---prolipoprotein diacylglyceryl transferase